MRDETAILAAEAAGWLKQTDATLHDSDFRISAQVIETVLRRVGEMA